MAEMLDRRRSLSQVHLGGGTPTFLDLEQLERLWASITRRFQVLSDAEVSVEVDPRVTTHAQLELLRSLGFNRISAGVQDLDPEVQEAIGRVQSEAQTQAVLDSARALGFHSVNFDLIYGLPKQTLAGFQRTLERVIAMRPDRLAVYSFAFVPSVKPQQKRLALLPTPSGSEKLELREAAHEMFTHAGYESIGMDHFALPEDELVHAQRDRRLWRNFQGYTVKAADDVIAVGSTGISDIGGVYAQNTKPLSKYFAAIDGRRLATERGAALSEDDLRRRILITNLLCNFWADLGPDWRTHFAPEIETLERDHIPDGLVELDGNEVTLTDRGRLFVRNVAMVFDAYLAKGREIRRFSRTV
jgi:oxygen-independent coproporphyrinogen-3 oxidase